LPNSHPLLPNLDQDFVSEMLRRIGVKSVDDLFADIPPRVRLRRRLRIRDGESEYAVRREVQATLASDLTPPSSLCFLGGGVWPHYVPAAVESIMSRQEFYTSYTPYQAEASQGMLQALFEYQSLMCNLLGMEACNASLYDWASAAGEAVRMASRVNGRKTILVGANVGPQRKAVMKSYGGPMGLEFRPVSFDKARGTLDLTDLKRKLSPDVSALYFENPNYFGVVEEHAAETVSAVQRAGALAIVGVDPISLSLIKEPGAYNADITVGEGQPLGISMNYGGPHLGIFAVREMRLARSMPGRLIGLTTTVAEPEQKAFAMALQTREQHIRREAATSNVCTNQSLMAVAAACYIALLGSSGFRQLGESVISNSHYAAKRISRVGGLTSPHFRAPFFKEFVVSYENAKATAVFKKLAAKGVLAGYPLGKEFRLNVEAGTFCVTEVHTERDIEKLAKTLEEVL
jgi:glycine dehydrogenase subunit 1